MGPGAEGRGGGGCVAYVPFKALPVITDGNIPIAEQEAGEAFSNYCAITGTWLQKRTLVENLMLLSGGGVVGGLLALTWRLVRGFAITEPFTKALGVFVLACMLLVVALTTLGQNKPTPAAA